MNIRHGKSENTVGRPTDYEERFCQMAYVACSEGGFTDKKLAKLFGVCESTINTWKREYPEFRDTWAGKPTSGEPDH